ncbi:MAG: hypothetical protein J7501_14090 [Bdellovibrio sp.]|nr:hypothetical protein [Bdellovibrio sp.]
MKSLLIAMLLVSGSAMAASNIDRQVASSPDDYQTVMLSWCDSNNVMSEDGNGQTIVRVNCSEQGKTCRDYQSFRVNRTVFAAACVDDNK